MAKDSDYSTHSFKVPAQELPRTLAVREDVIGEAGEIQLAVEFEPEGPIEIRTRYIRTVDAHETKMRNGNAGCAYIDPASRRRCGSHHQLELDHVVEYSRRGGSNEAMNLQVMCAKHNRYRWRESARSRVRSVQG